MNIHCDLPLSPSSFNLSPFSTSSFHLSRSIEFYPLEVSGISWINDDVGTGTLRVPAPIEDKTNAVRAKVHGREGEGGRA